MTLQMNCWTSRGGELLRGVSTLGQNLANTTETGVEHDNRSSGFKTLNEYIIVRGRWQDEWCKMIRLFEVRLQLQREPCQNDPIATYTTFGLSLQNAIIVKSHYKQCNCQVHQQGAINTEFSIIKDLSSESPDTPVHQDVFQASRSSTINSSNSHFQPLQACQPAPMNCKRYSVQKKRINFHESGNSTAK